MMFVFARAATYSALFIGLLLILLPDRILSSTGIVQPDAIGFRQGAGMLLAAAGALLALACILTSWSSGKGLPHRSIRLAGWSFTVPTGSSAIRCISEPSLR